MIRRLRNVLAVTAIATALAAPAFAQSSILLPPYDGSSPTAKIATDGQALAALRAEGITAVGHLGRVGDYWEGAGLRDGRPVIAYAFSNGNVEVKAATRDELRQAEIVLPPVSG